MTNSARPRPRPALALLLALAGLLAACGDDTAEPAGDGTEVVDDATTTSEDATHDDAMADDDATTDGDATADDSGESGDDSGESGDGDAAGAEGDDGDLTVTAEVAGGVVTTDADRYDIGLGREVAITVTSDVAEEIHLHGYDLSADVAPGQPAELLFVADVAGVFEVELEDSGTFLFELAVS